MKYLTLAVGLFLNSLRSRFASTFYVVALACGVAASAVAQTATVTLAWDPPADTTGISEYHIYVRPAAGTYPSTFHTVAGANSSSLTLNSLTPGSYFFVAKSFGSGVESVASNEVSVTAVQMGLEALAPTALNGRSINARVFNVGGTSALINTTVSANGSGVIAIPGGASGLPAAFDLRLDTISYLAARFVNRSLSATTALAPLLAGDLDDTGIINGFDYSLIKQRWLSADPVADIDRNGVVNSFDYAYLKKNWFQSDSN